MRRGDGEGGALTLWLLGLSVAVLFLGGLSLDLWRAYTVRATLAGMADAAVTAGATGLEEASYREDSAARLEPALAEARAWEQLRAQPHLGLVTAAEVDADAEQVRVLVRGEVGLTLLRVLMADAAPLEIAVSAASAPRRR
jgi:Flp pilus assembly protein TadG